MDCSSEENPLNTDTPRIHREKNRLFVFSVLPLSLGVSVVCLVLEDGYLGAAETPTPVFTVHTADGTTASGELQELRDDGSLAVRGENLVRVKSGELISLRRAGAPLPPPPSGPHLFLTNGDRLPGTPLRLAGERLLFSARLGQEQELSVPLAAVSVLWLAPPRGDDDAPALLRRLATQQRPRDVVFLRNGDVVEGSLTALEPTSLRLEANGRQVPVEMDRVAAVAFNTELVRTLRPRGPYSHLVLANGARLSVTAAHADGRSLSAKTPFGAEVRLPLDQLVALDVRQGRADYLSDLKPRRYEHTPYLGVSWPYVRDASVLGHDLHVGGSSYDKGLGVHSACRLTFDLAAGYRRFEALVGLDDRTGRQGSVRVRVLVDGKPRDLGWNEELTGHDAPRPVRVPVLGARELTLEVQFGRNGDVQDHVDWADARLIR